MSTLIDTIKTFLPDSLLNDLASRLGEGVSAVQAGLGTLIPGLLAGMIRRSEEPGALQGLFDQLANPRNLSFLDDLGGLIGGGNLAHGDPKDIAGQLVGSLFGAQTGDLLSGARQLSGLKSENSVSALLGLAGPLVMGVVGKRIADEGLSADGVKALFSREKESVGRMLPVGLASLLGLSVPAAHASTSFNTLAITERGMAGRVLDPKNKFGALLPLLLAAAFAGLVYVIMQNRPAPAAPVTADIPAPVPAETVTAPQEDPVVPASDPATVSDPSVPQSPVAEPVPNATFSAVVGGVSLTGNAGGVEDGLIAFVESGRMPCTDKDCWFTMDRLTFATGSANLDMERSSAQLDNIAAIMRAYSTIQLKVGGYTDDRGDLAANMRLSQARAEAVVAALVARGLPAERFNAEGYGPQHPVASNDTEEGRARNRRIDVRVRQR